MMDKNLELNDFDFVLFHLYQSNKTYREYYQKMRKEHPERLMILDNSAYEFFVKGEKLDMLQFKNTIKELKPDYYILPDVLQDKEKTLHGVREFLKCYVDKDMVSKPLAVAQGNTSMELVECFQEYLLLGIDYVGVPFHLEFYKNISVEDDILFEFGVNYEVKSMFLYSEDYKYATGRVQWVRDHETLLKRFGKVHMLGSHCPLEKMFYHDFYSMDTGYPVKLGYEKKLLGSESHKPASIIDDFIDEELPDTKKFCIETNIKTFRDL
jgi:hypothetical protein